MSFPCYPAYKDSGVEWLGVVPEHWEVRRVRRIFEIKKRIAGEPGFDILSITQQGIKVRDPESNDGQVSMDYSKYQIVEPGDFAMNHMDLLTGYVDISRRYGVTSPDYRVFSIAEPLFSDPGYLLYIFQMGYKQKILYAFGQGSSQLGRWRLPTEGFQEWSIPFPSREEQVLISTFLDRETAKIDALIAEQQRLIELLQEKRQAVISHAVTKGLNPTASMKDSGVEWLGQVPEHWEVVPLKRIVAMQSGNTITGQLIEPAGDYPVYGGNGLRGYTSTFTHDGEYALIGRQGALCGNVNYATGKFFASEHAVVATPLKLVEVSWLGEMMRTMNLNQYSVSAAQPGLSVELIGNVVTIYAPIEEQGILAKFLSLQNEVMNGLSKVSLKTIDLLQERRSALISAAVTGQIDVRCRVDRDNATD